MRQQGKNALGMLGWVAVIIACLAGLGMGGGDGTTPAPDFSKLGQMFDVKDAGPKPAKEPAKKGGTAKAREMCPDDPKHCWWQ